MKGTFADTSFYVALLNPRDELHAPAARLATELTVPVLTTTWILVEVGNFMAARSARPVFVRFIDQLRNSRRTRIIRASEALFGRGFDLYADRGDKDWSLTDCISFVVMKERGVRDALTADHHFKQAGFRPLLTD